MCGLSTVVTPAGASLTMYREIRSYANSIWDDNNNNSTAFRADDTTTSSITRRQEKSFIYFVAETCACDTSWGAPYYLQSLIQHHPSLSLSLSSTVAVLLLVLRPQTAELFFSLYRIDVASGEDSAGAGGGCKPLRQAGTYAKRLGLRVACVRCD